MRKHPLHSSVEQPYSSPGLLTDRSDGQNKRKSVSLQNSFTETKLPVIQIRKVMKKIGAVEKDGHGFMPSDEQRLAFRKSKWQELRDQYSTRRGKKEPFNYELDEIVLDCWEYGQKFGRKTIWKKYKQNFDELTFDTLRVVHRKKL